MPPTTALSPSGSCVDRVPLKGMEPMRMGKSSLATLHEPNFAINYKAKLNCKVKNCRGKSNILKLKVSTFVNEYNMYVYLLQICPTCLPLCSSVS